MSFFKVIKVYIMSFAKGFHLFFLEIVAKIILMGALQEGTIYGEVRAVIWMNEYKYYKFMPNYGLGTNTKSELIILWMLLFCVKHFGIIEIRVIGDSKNCIDWINGKCTPQVV